MYYLTTENGVKVKFKSIYAMAKRTKKSESFIYRSIADKASFVLNGELVRASKRAPQAPEPAGFVAFFGENWFRAQTFKEIGEKLKTPQNTIAYACKNDSTLKNGWRVWPAKDYAELIATKKEEVPEKPVKVFSAFKKNFSRSWRDCGPVLGPNSVHIKTGRGEEPHIRVKLYE